MERSRLWIIGVVFISFVGFVGAGGQAVTQEEGESKIEWKLLNAVPYAEDWYTTVLDRYMVEHPEQSYEMTSLPWTDFYEKFTVAASTGSEMDMLFLDISLVMEMSKSKLLMDLTDKLGDTSVIRFDHPAGKIYVFEGRKYAIPINGLDTMAVYYNKDIFRKLGMNVPETYNELLPASKKLRQNGIGPFLTNGEAWQWSNVVGTINAQVIDSYDQYMVDLANGKHKFTDPTLLQGLDWLRKFRDDNVFVDNIIGIDENSSYSMFITGKAAMFFQGTWIAPILEEMVESQTKLDNFGVIHFPFLTDQRRIGAHGGFLLSVALYKDIMEAKREPAIDLLRYMISREVCKELSELDGAVLGTRRDVKVDMSPLTLGFEPIADHTFAPWEAFWPQELVNAHRENSRGVAGGLITPEKAASNIQAVFDRLKK